MDARSSFNAMISPLSSCFPTFTTSLIWLPLIPLAMMSGPEIFAISPISKHPLFFSSALIFYLRAFPRFFLFRGQVYAYRLFDHGAYALPAGLRLAALSWNRSHDRLGAGFDSLARFQRERRDEVFVEYYESDFLGVHERVEFCIGIIGSAFRRNPHSRELEAHERFRKADCSNLHFHSHFFFLHLRVYGENVLPQLLLEPECVGIRYFSQIRNFHFLEVHEPYCRGETHDAHFRQGED